MPALRSLLAAWALMLTVASSAQHLAPRTAPPAGKQVLADFLMEWMQARYPAAPSEGYVLYVSVHSQRMYLVVEGQMQAEFVVSTARNGLGGAMHSNRTPEGLHRVARKFGQGVPPWGIFKARQFTGEIATDTAAGDMITSRILWLAGLEPGMNAGGTVDSMARGIYIHGTADERSLGTPSSQGCIRMRNTDVIALHDRVPLGTLVVILDN